jgi:hypothetical protein
VLRAFKSKIGFNPTPKYFYSLIVFTVLKKLLDSKC